MKLADLVIQYRNAHSLSQRQFALQCGLSNGYISMIEKGVNPSTGKPITPTFPQLKKMASGMNITVMELFERIDDMPIDISGQTSGPQLTVSECAEVAALSYDEVELIRKFRRLDERGKSAVLIVLDHEYDSLPGEKTYSKVNNA